MITRISITLALIFILSSFVYAQAAVPSPWSNCDFPQEVRDGIERWLNRSIKEAKKAIEDGTEYDGKVHKLEQCKIDEIKNIYNKLKVEYDCSCSECGRGGPSHERAPRIPVIRICDPIASWLDYIDNDLTQPQKTMCGCPHGLIVHELVHAAGDPTEAGALDCARILYPCANDTYGDATPNHKNCKCCEKKGDNMTRKILCFIIITFLFVFIHLQSNEDKCNPSTPSSPGGDQPDENYSYSNGNYNTPDITNLLIFENGFFKEADSLINGTFFNMPETAENLLKKSPLLIIPCGGLYGRENDSLLKIVLREYVRMGGTILVFAQQYDSHIDSVVPVPGGESLKTYGWRQDSSCLRNSVFFESVHPALSSSTNELLDAGVDGYFSVYPSNSTILLKRKINLEPALLYYPYRNGTVILTSMFTDWAYAHSQATISEIKIIRDLITFAKNPKVSIPMFDLEQNPTPSINLDVEIKNISETPASKAKLMVYSPDRTTLLHQLEAPLSLNPGESTQIAINFTLPELQTKDYGICHVDYELYNAENEIIQLPTESAGGRFSIYKIITPVTIKDGVYMWVTVKDENVYWGQDAQFTIHFKNTTTETKTLDLNDPFFDLAHDRIGPSFPSFQVSLPPGGEYAHVALMPTGQFSRYPKCAYSVRIQYHDSNGVLKQTGPGKVIFVYGTLTENTLELNNSSSVPPNGNIFDDLQWS